MVFTIVGKVSISPFQVNLYDFSLTNYVVFFCKIILSTIIVIMKFGK